MCKLCVQMDEGVVRLQDIITRLQKFDNLPAETEKAVEKARALVKDSASSRQVRILLHVWSEETDTQVPLLLWSMVIIETGTQILLCVWSKV